MDDAAHLLSMSTPEPAVEDFVTADLHWFHEAILGYTARGRIWANVEVMAEDIVGCWNGVVAPASNVFVLGDWSAGGIEARTRALALLGRLNGTKHLIAGNHDKCGAHDPNGWRHIGTYLDAGFASVTQAMSIKLPAISKKRPARRVMLSHYPYDGDHTEGERFAEVRLRDEGIPMVHGHVHEAYRTARSIKGTPTINAGIDVWNYKPVPLKTLAAMFDAAENGDW